MPKSVGTSCNRICHHTRAGVAALCFSATDHACALQLLGHHHLDELLIIDLAVAVNVRLTDHLIHLFVRQLLAQVRHHVAQLCCADEAVAVAVEDLEGLDELLLGVRVLHLPGHEAEELREVDGSVAIGIHFVDHVLELRLGGVLPQGAHHRAQLLRGDGAIAVLVKKREGLLELGDLLLGELVRHDARKEKQKRGTHGDVTRV
mmetsp:Transcript_26522/g.70382  ORF Transcript_26522/g.70382 Transcript_26522/m.70382 type:complete len:204 (-) Transcript_26522:20-631(-)